jgi:hypothetical protein
LTATVTATSADDGHGRWIVVAVVGSAEGVAEGVDGLALEAEAYVGVDACGDADVGVSEEFLDDDEVHALFQEQGGGRVPEVMKADAAESGPVEEATEATGEVGRVERSTGRRGEDQATDLPARADSLALHVLPLLVFLEGMEAFGREGDAAFGRSGLGGQMCETAGAGALERAPDAGRSGGEVEVFPVESEEFALAEASAEGEFVQRLEPVGAGGVKATRWRGSRAARPPIRPALGSATAGRPATRPRRKQRSVAPEARRTPGRRRGDGRELAGA